MEEVYDSNKVKQNLENVLTAHVYQHIDAEEELSKMLSNQLNQVKPDKTDLKTVLLHLSKITQYFEELNSKQEKLLAELNGNPVDDKGPVKGQAESGILPRLVRLCEYLERQLADLEINNHKLQEIIGG